MRRNLLVTSLLLFLFVCVFTVIEKDHLPSSDLESEYVEATPLAENALLVSTDIEEWADELKSCTYPNCAEYLPVLRAYYQRQADATCKPIRVTVRCCAKGVPVFRVLDIKPTPACSHPNPFFPDFDNG